jgi:DNA-binding NarL/FixJ family response regulator
VLALVAAGLPSAAIAERLGVAPRTVDVHVRSAMEKLGARNRLQATLLVDGIQRIDALDHRHCATLGDGALSADEQRAIELIAAGLSVPQVARALHFSPRTVDRRLAHARAVLGVETTAEAAAAVLGARA